ncbi:hypothetical protein K440DRAFT_652074 [Wilcoxina mikolae CBS 423.85]|nr:hypothetical protein K440DRAFT_652074 [Wilcoxina mikolae CBS 423.85]
MLLPGRPQSTPQALCTGEWQRKRIVAYISGTSIIILGGVDKLIQTIYLEHRLEAIAFDENTGKIAVCAKGKVYVFRPNGRAEGYLKWSLQTQIALDSSDGAVTTLSWGASEELLVGSNSLTLWSTAFANDTADVRLLWRQRLANPTKLALVSSDASLAASVAEHDRLVKIWRKISIGGDDNQADYSYLPHPRAVVWMQWRQPVHPEETADNVLYTITKDQVLRVWAPVYPHDAHLLQLWTTVDLRESIPRYLDEPKDDVHHALIVDSRVFRRATEQAVATAGESDREREALQRLVEVANRSPEVVVVFDSHGRMSAWGLENVGCKSRKTTDMFSIVHAEKSGVHCGRSEVRFAAFAGGEGLVVLMHSFDGRICWMETRLDTFLDPTPDGVRFGLKGIWTGHNNAIQSLVRTADGTSMLSSTETNKHILWTKTTIAGMDTLRRKSILQPPNKVERAVILDGGSNVMTLHTNHVILWDTAHGASTEMARCSFTSNGKMLCLLLLPEVVDSPPVYRVVAIDEEMTGIAWEVTLPIKSHSKRNGTTNGNTPYLRELAKFDLGPRSGLLAIIPVDPVGWNAVLSENLDMFSREVATTISKSGLVRSWTVKVYKEDSALKWLATSTVETGILNPSLAKGNSIRKIALVDELRTEITIWDSKAAQLEYRQVSSDGTDDLIQDLDWTSTPQSQSILAVGYKRRVVLMCQLRYDYLNAGPAWALFREINIEAMTPHPIGDSLWLQDGGLVIGSGNQLFLYPRKIDGVDKVLDSLHLTSHKTKLDDIFDIVSELNGPLPTYHPQFLQQCILAGKSELVEEILIKLYKELRNYHEEIGLDTFLDLPIDRYIARDKPPVPVRRASSYSPFYDSAQDEDTDLTTFDETLAAKLCELLTTISIPHMTGPEQINLAAIVESVAQVKKHRRSIDEHGAQYLLFFRQYNLQRKAPMPEMSWREITWAFHSDSQEILIDLVNRNFQGRMLWNQARESGIFMWLRDTEAIKQQFEAIARNHYTRTDEKNPVDCSLHYLALKKKNVLLGLWRMARWHPEQAVTMKFLSNNFSEARWKTAALKNAYALMGKHRFEYAAAFFLLADSLKDAMAVIFTSLHDPQLAIAVARVYEGSDGPVLSNFLETKILPYAIAEGNRWLVSWTFWMLKRKDMAVRALLSPLDSLVPGIGGSRDPSSRLFLLFDPALIIFYKHIRERTTTTFKGAQEITPAMEWDFVITTARVYDRMGCDLLALDLVKNWEFLRAEKKKEVIRMGMRARRNSLMVMDAPPPQVAAISEQNEKDPQKWKEGLVKPPAAVWEEPDMSWAF